MNATHALGWALVHFLWQGAALALFLGILLALMRPRAARTRYALSLLTLGAMLIVPITTTLRLYTRPVAATGSPVTSPMNPANLSRQRNPAATVLPAPTTSGVSAT